MKVFDWIIVGGGIAGISIAEILTREGHSVALIEKKNKVSCHFLINKEGKIFSLVDLKKRAWHAGQSFWKGEKDINSNSIGIELDNTGHYINFERYTKKQRKTLKQLPRKA